MNGIEKAILPYRASVKSVFRKFTMRRSEKQFPISFRPARMTPKPVVHGSQTAIVVDPAGEEIHVDEHGRVKVQFHWDRKGKKDDKSSAGSGLVSSGPGLTGGAMFIPRIGQEVIVDFLEGDAVRPIITGRVYNGLNKPLYPLPHCH
jgi:type VI secretion system secreted protein VgrG